MTGLERVSGAIDGGLQNARKREIGLMREFIRRAHQYLFDVPEVKNGLEWLALMQHHGAPTRLLDWTYSLHVAAHFALKHALENGANLVIWMIDTKWCLTASQTVAPAFAESELARRPISSKSEKTASAQLFDPNMPAPVWPINPFRLNERLSIQRGVFLAPGDPTKPFEENLLALPGMLEKENLCKITIPRSAAMDVGRNLYDANITDRTLFPGLDGFARSLWITSRYLGLEGLDSLDDI